MGPGWERRCVEAVVERREQVRRVAHVLCVVAARRHVYMFMMFALFYSALVCRGRRAIRR